MINLVTFAAHLQCDATAQAGTHELDQTKHPPAFDDGPEESILPLPGVRQVSMGKKGSLPTQLLLPTVGVNLNLHSKPVREEGVEKEVVISFKVLDPNPHPGESLETLEYRKVFRKRKRRWIRSNIVWPRNISKSEKKLEEVAQNHEMPHSLPLGIQESKERFHPFPVLSGKMSVGDEDPVLFGTNQCVSPSPPHTAIVKSQPFHLIGIVNVPEIDKDGGFQEAFDLLEIQSAKLIPFRRQNQGVTTLGHVVGSFPNSTSGEDGPGFFHRSRIIGPDPCSLLEEDLNDGDGRGFPDVVRVRFKREPQDPDRLPPKLSHPLFDFIDHPLFLFLVHLNDRVEDLKRVPLLLSQSGQGPRVLWKAGPPITRTRMEKLSSDPSIQTHGPGHMMNIGAHPLAEIRYLVDEGHLGGQKGVRCILNHLGGLERGDDKRGLDEIEGAIDVLHDRHGLLTLRADGHPVGSHEVLNGRTLLSETRDWRPYRTGPAGSDGSRSGV